MPESLKKIALVVTFGTLASKFGGLARQLIIATVFGVGSAYDAYNYAYIVPGFFLILLGGINGPFHNSMVSVLSKLQKSEQRHVLSAITTITSSVLILITIIIFFNSNLIIHIVGPGLSKEAHIIAVKQLQIMSPIALFAGLIGLGFGSLNASNEFLIPSISPLISSITLILFILTFWIHTGSNNPSNEILINGGIVLGFGTLVGAFFQWAFQLPYLIRKQLGKIKIIWDLKHHGVKEVLRILGPATLSAGMLQINVFTDLFFASSIAGAAAGLSYATFLIQAPLGLLSNALLIPLLPEFAKLSAAGKRIDLIKRIQQGLIFSATSMIILGSIFISLAEPIVELIYQRGAFNSNAVSLVTSLLIAYGIGMPAYLCRDLLVRIFYSFGEAKIPFFISTLGIVLNIIFDWILIGGPTLGGNQFSFNYGAQGLVLATAIVNSICCIILIFQLSKTLKGLPIYEWIGNIFKLLIAGIFAGLASLLLRTSISWPANIIGLILEIFLSSGINLIVFIYLGLLLKVKEISELLLIIYKRFIPH